MKYTMYTVRYLAYCVSQGGYAPGVIQARDRARYPGGIMTGYITWIGGRWAEWTALSGAHPYCRSEQDHKNFDAWLSAKHGISPNAPKEGAEK